MIMKVGVVIVHDKPGHGIHIMCSKEKNMIGDI